MTTLRRYIGAHLFLLMVRIYPKETKRDRQSHNVFSVCAKALRIMHEDNTQ